MTPRVRDTGTEFNQGMYIDARKPVLGVSNQVNLEHVCLATGKVGLMKRCLETLLSIIFYSERITKALIRLCGCAGWSTYLLFTCNKVRLIYMYEFLFIITPIVGVCNCSIFVVRYFMSI